MVNGADLQRHPDWEQRLAALIDGWLDASYLWNSTDCGHFAAACTEAVTGVRVWPADLGAYRSERGLLRALKRCGWSGLDKMATAMLGPPIAPLAAHRGDILWDGQALAVMGPAGPMAMTHDGLCLIARDSIRSAWPVGRANG